MALVNLTEDEMEIAILALEDFKSDRLHEYDLIERQVIRDQIGTALKKLRDAT